MGAVAISRDGSLQLAEFESAISKLMLSRLLEANMLGPLPAGSPSAVVKKLLITDYNSHDVACKDIMQCNLCEFFFGQMDQGDIPVKRWIHMPELDSTLLLALAVKYSLHPLAVEEVFKQRVA